MLGKIFGSNKGDKAGQREADIAAFSKTCAKWNLENIQNYLRGKEANLETTDAGLAAILTKFNTHESDDSKSPKGKRREFEPYDRLERTKKGLDLVLAIMGHKALSPESLDLIPEFLTRYKDVIEDLDKKLSQTYAHKLKESYKNAQIAALTKLQMKKSLNMRY